MDMTFTAHKNLSDQCRYAAYRNQSFDLGSKKCSGSKIGFFLFRRHMKLLHYIIISLILYGSALFADSVNNVIFADTKADHKSNEIIVKFRKEATGKTIREICRTYNLTMLSYHKKADFYRMKASSESNPFKISGKLNKDSSVHFAHPDYYLYNNLKTDPDDLQLYNSNCYSTKSVSMHKDVKVVFIGNSVDPLICRYKDGEINSKEFFAVNSYDSLKTSESENGYGVTLNKREISGQTVLLTVSDVAESIYLAADSGADIISIIVSGPHCDLLKQAVTYAFSRGITVFSSSCEHNENKVVYPCGYENICIAVKPLRSDNPVLPQDGFRNKTIVVPDHTYDWSIDPAKRKQEPFLAVHYVTNIAAALNSRGINGSDAIRRALFESADKCYKGEQGTIGNCRIINCDGALNFYPEKVHDLALESIQSPSWCLRSEDVKITVTVKNEGTYKENSIVRLRNNTSNKLLGTKTLILESGVTDSVVFIWSTGEEQYGANELMASVDIPDETDMGDNSCYSTINILQDRRDVAVYGIEPVLDESSVLNTSASLMVNIANLGTYTEMVTLTVKDSLNGNVIGTVDTLLQADEQITVCINWNTKDVNPGVYNLKAELFTIDNMDSDPENNHACNIVTISKPEIQKAESKTANLNHN